MPPKFHKFFCFLATKQSFHLFTRKIFAYLYFTKSFSIQSQLVVAGMQEQILAHSGSAQYLAGPRRRQSGKISQKCSNIWSNTTGDLWMMPSINLSLCMYFRTFPFSFPSVLILYSRRNAQLSKINLETLI